MEEMALKQILIFSWRKSMEEMALKQILTYLPIAQISRQDVAEISTYFQLAQISGKNSPDALQILILNCDMNRKCSLRARDSGIGATCRQTISSVDDEDDDDD